MLDFRSLIISLVVVTVTLAFCMFYFFSSRKTYPGFLNWTIGFLGMGTGLLLIGLRDRIPDFFAIVIGNSIVLASFILFYLGFVLFAKKDKKYSLHLIFFSIFLFCFSILTYIIPSAYLRTSLLSIYIAIYCSGIVKISINDLKTFFNNTNKVLVGLSIFLTLFFSFRTIFFLFAHIKGENSNTLVAQVQSVAPLVFIALMIVFIICLIQLNYQMLEKNFLESYKKIEKAKDEAEKATQTKSEFLAT
ncbi:MAG: hypothetical protein GY699_01920, partial [Desulfobacteraceae bacterium]|nr:hypothetical protein [Desulfobacteraceae bacterium]